MWVSSTSSGNPISAWDGGESAVIRRPGKKMPALLVASKMKSGLPKPVHSALPIPQTHSRPSALALPPAPVKTHIPSQGQQVCSRPPRSITSGSEAAANPQVRMQNIHLHPSLPSIQLSYCSTAFIRSLSTHVLLLSTATLYVLLVKSHCKLK